MLGRADKELTLSSYWKLVMPIILLRIMHVILFCPHNNSYENGIMNSILQMGKLRPKKGSWLPKVTLKTGQKWGGEFEEMLD